MLRNWFASQPDMLKIASRRLTFLNWLTPLLIVLLPLSVSLMTALPYALNVHTTPDHSPLGLIEFVVPMCTRVTSDFLLISAVLLVLCTTSLVRAKIGQYQVFSLATLFSILLIIFLWSKLPMANIISIMSSVAYSGARVQVHSPQPWVHFVSAGGTVLILLNLVTVIGQKKTA